MGSARGAAFCSQNLALLENLCLFKSAYAQGKVQTSESVVLPALAKRFILKVACYSNHIVRS